MYDKCEACGKWIKDASDCKLASHNGETIHTFCKECYDNRLKSDNK